MRWKIALVVVAAALAGSTSYANGVLKVTSFPGGANVYVDGEDTGKTTPMTVNLIEGDHEVTVEVPGGVWMPDTRIVTIVQGNNDLSVTLMPDFSDLEAQVQDQQLQINALSAQLAAAQAQIAVLEADLSSATSAIAALETDVAIAQADVDNLASSSIFALEDYVWVTLDPIENLAGPSIVFEGANVHVRNGEGATDTINGLGNLIVGYNEYWSGTYRTGSHNLVVGDYNMYTSYGGFVAGTFNSITGPRTSVTGGLENTASANTAVVTGGRNNQASNLACVVSGGLNNIAGGGGHYSWVGGGGANVASGNSAAVVGGVSNQATSNHATVVGGSSNAAYAYNSTVSGGAFRTVSGENDWRAGNLFEDD